MIDRKNEMLEYLEIMEYKLIDMLSNPTIIRKINNSNYNGYVHDKLKKEFLNWDTRRAESILDSFKFRKLEKIKPEEPIESDEVKIADLSDIPPQQVMKKK